MTIYASINSPDVMLFPDTGDRCLSTPLFSE